MSNGDEFSFEEMTAQMYYTNYNPIAHQFDTECQKYIETIKELKQK